MLKVKPILGLQTFSVRKLCVQEKHLWDTSSLSCTSSLELLHLPQQRWQFQKWCPLSICSSFSGNSPKNRGVGRTVYISSWQLEPHVAKQTRAVVEQSPRGTFTGSSRSGCNAEHTEQPLPPRAHCEPPPVSWDKLLVLTSWTRG